MPQQEPIPPQAQQQEPHLGVNGGSRPIPDPTELTDRALARQERTMRDYIDGQIGMRDTRINAIDEATRIRKEEFDRVPGLIATDISHLEKLVDEKFEAAERLRVEQKKDTKDAVDAALNAAKEAVKEQTASSEKSITKSELATGAQIKQLQDTFATAIEGLRRAFDDLKDREVEDVRTLRQSITDVATTANSTVSQRAGAKEDRTGLYAALAALGTIIFLTIAIVSFMVATAQRATP